MHCHLKMIRIFMRGLLWLLLFGFGYMALSLEPGFLDFDNLPDTNFSCVGKVIGGYYADLETNCQMFHVCTIGQLDEPMDIRFLCLNGTVFDQETRVCERIDEVDCTKSEHFYSLNLELYGNTQPPVVEDSPGTDPPIVIKASTTTTTTTTTENPKPKTTRTAYYTTATPSSGSTATNSKGIASHHFPISSAPDIRFNPEEINISLNPGAAPSIRTKTSYQQPKSVVTTHIEFGNENKDEIVHVQKPHPASTTDIPKSVVNYELTHKDVAPSDVNYGFNFEHQVDEESQIYQTEVPQRNYQYHNHYRPGLHGQFRHQFRTSTLRTTTGRNQLYHHSNTGVTTYRNPYPSSLKPPQYQQNYNTEKPQRLQLPLPLLPTLPPLTFSTPAPFTLSRHIETKRFTNEHHSPPRIIISASASVSDASGRRLNYSLGTIGVTPILDDTPKSYDDYKEHDVVLDPFYRDVPKVKSNVRRKKRSPQEKNVSKGEDEAVDVLRFLFNWYKDHETSATSTVTPPEPTTMIGRTNSGEDSLSKDTEESSVSILPTVEPATINNEFYKEYEKATIASTRTTWEYAAINDGADSNEVPSNHPNFTGSDLFRKGSKYNIVGDVFTVTEKSEQKELTTDSRRSANFGNDADYVNDNYEPVVYKENSESKQKDSTLDSRRSENLHSNTDYVNDNYEPVVYKERSMEISEKDVRENRHKGNEEKADILSVAQQKMQEESPADLKSLEYSEDGDREYVDDNYEPVVFEEQTTLNSDKEVNRSNEYSENFATTENYKHKIGNKSITKLPDTDLDKLKNDNTNDGSGSDEKEYTVTPLTPKTELEESPKLTERYESDASISDKDSYGKASRDDPFITNRSKIEESSKNYFDKMNDEKSNEDSTTPSGFKFKKEYERLIKKIFQTDEENYVNAKTNSRIDNQSSNHNDLDSLKNTRIPVNSLNITSKRDKSEVKHDIINDQLDDQNTDSSQNITENGDFKTPKRAEEETTIFVIVKKATPKARTFQSNDTKLDDDYHSQTVFNKEASPQSTNMSLSNLKTNVDQNSDEPSKVSTLGIIKSGGNEPNEETTTENQQNTYFEVTTSPDETATENIEGDGQKYTLTTSRDEYTSRTGSTLNSLDDTTISRYDGDSKLEVTTPTSGSLILKKPPENGEFYTSIATEFFDDITTITNPSEDNILTTSSPTTTKPSLTTARRRTNNRRNRPSNYRPRSNQNSRKFSTHHRLGTEHRKTRPNRRKPSDDEQRMTYISATTTGKISLVELPEVTTFVESNPDLGSTSLVTSSDFATTDEQPATSDSTFTDNIEDVPSTDAPLYKSANPTKAESEREGNSFLLHTTPLTMTYKVQVRRERIHSFVFNCFDKPINRYYSDPRDCRLFHYCTSGYTRNQLLDMKFVCDLGTYFDDEKLICTKTKPSRCL